MLIYPPTGKQQIEVTLKDVDRLLPGERLNDTMIEFGLR